MKRYIGEVPNKGASVFIELGTQHSDMWKHSYSPKKKLSKPLPFIYLFFFMEASARLIKSLVVGDQFNLQPLSPPGMSVEWN